MCKRSDSGSSSSSTGVDQAVQPGPVVVQNMDETKGLHSKPRTTRQVAKLKLDKPEFKTLETRLSVPPPIQDVPFHVSKNGNVIRRSEHPLHDSKCKMSYDRPHDYLTVEVGGVAFSISLEAKKIGMRGLYRISGELAPLGRKAKSVYGDVASNFTIWYETQFDEIPIAIGHPKGPKGMFS
jgi:hypothetical protein